MAHDLFDVVSVECLEGHLLRLRFDDGAEGIFDMSPWMDRKPYTALRSPTVFNGASISFGTVVWPGGIDIDPETLRNGVRYISRDALAVPDTGLSCVAESATVYNDSSATQQPPADPLAPPGGI